MKKSTNQLVIKNTNKYKFYIYLIHNSVNGKNYVGQTSNIKDRFYACHRSKTFMEDYYTFGRYAFDLKILARTNDQSKAEKLEKKYAEQYDCFKNGYNIRPYYHNNTGFKRTKESNQKRSATMHNTFWMHNDIKNTRVQDNLVESYLNAGFVLGRLIKNPRALLFDIEFN